MLRCRWSNAGVAARLGVAQRASAAWKMPSITASSYMGLPKSALGLHRGVRYNARQSQTLHDKRKFECINVLRKDWWINYKGFLREHCFSKLAYSPPAHMSSPRDYSPACRMKQKKGVVEFFEVRRSCRCIKHQSIFDLMDSDAFRDPYLDQGRDPT